jgi:predicted CXXCH cytochrome family protein
MKAEQFENSVHARNKKFGFSCWKCHDPHTYSSLAEEDAQLTDRMVYHNAICLRCHSKVKPVELDLGEPVEEEQKSHFWLPNQPLHFAGVRCIDCHNSIDRDMLLTHQILPMEQAEKRCVDCHSKDSKLLATLYKYRAKEQRSNKGFLSGDMLEGMSIIGVQDDNYLNLASVIIFLFILSGMVVHIILRIRLKKSKTNS